MIIARSFQKIVSLNFKYHDASEKSDAFFMPKFLT